MSSPEGGPLSNCAEGPVQIDAWYESNRELFSPPICNKLMHKQQMTVMFVGGPNRRRDFHLDRGSEFFYQIRGSMMLPIILPYNKLKIVEIKAGQVFLLPSCVPHSPQRPEEGSLGLVLERERYEDEPDGLRYFQGFDFIQHGDAPEKLDVDKILWEKFFSCRSLAEDLVPVVNAFAASEECKQNKPTAENVHSWKCAPDGADPDRTHEPKFPVNAKIQDVPEPFYLQDWLNAAAGQLEVPNVKISLFGDRHPDKEYVIEVHGMGQFAFEKANVDTLVLQHKGTCKVTREDGVYDVLENGCFIIPAGQAFECAREAGSIGLFVQQHPYRNAEFYGYKGFEPH